MVVLRPGHPEGKGDVYVVLKDFVYKIEMVLEDGKNREPR